ncbi:MULTISPECIES: ABC transporter ATP-binding protein [unclassified Beijerinckia]|uniref:ABC transporter ATP-binding protein n=1 Tax=unclassified Beijerinckia TaxID=2638183 RepID=UPI000B131EF7|nr:MULTISPECIES: ABC transporter ATP-binding protein [unclassified Beijerinckia]
MAAEPSVKAGKLTLRHVSKSYDVDGRDLLVLDNVDLTIAPGEFTSIVGPSGCGKSTLLRLIVGLDDEYAGDIQLDDERIVGTSLKRGIVFQDHRLLPWLTLERNIELGLENSDVPRAARRAAVADLLDLVGLNGFEKVFPYQLSGGMAQRAAIARGLVTKPEVLLLDEPLGALDALTRQRLQEELLTIWEAEQVTMVLVTHDVEEAIYLSKRVIVMHPNPGRIAADIAIDLPYPRDRASDDFARIRREVLDAMGASTHVMIPRRPKSAPVVDASVAIGRI